MADGLKQDEKWGYQQCDEGLCADLMDYVRKAAKFSRLPVPIRVTTLLIETENVNDLLQAA